MSLKKVTRRRLAEGVTWLGRDGVLTRFEKKSSLALNCLRRILSHEPNILNYQDKNAQKTFVKKFTFVLKFVYNNII